MKVCEEAVTLLEGADDRILVHQCATDSSEQHSSDFEFKFSFYQVARSIKASESHLPEYFTYIYIYIYSIIYIYIYIYI